MKLDGPVEIHVIRINQNKKHFALIGIALAAYAATTIVNSPSETNGQTSTKSQTDADGSFPWNRSATAVDTVAPDGDLTKGSEGTKDLVLSPDLIRRFDFHLNAMGEKSLAQITQLVTQQLKAELNAKSAQEALRLFQAYVNYKQALASVKEQPHTADINALIAQMKKGREIRSRFFTQTESQALFGKDDEYDDYTAKRIEIQMDQSITSEQKTDMLNALKAKLSAQTIQDITEPVIHLTLNERVEQARSRGASPQEIHNIRAEMVGQAAAERLAQLDAQEAQWQQRIAQYKAAVAERPQQAQSIKESMFDIQERLRVDTVLNPQNSN